MIDISNFIDAASGPEGPQLSVVDYHSVKLIMSCSSDDDQLLFRRILGDCALLFPVTRHFETDCDRHTALVSTQGPQMADWCT